jgi:putative tricarboxylic transport membrane protein
MIPRKEIAGSFVLILFSLTFLIYTTRYPLETWESPGPAAFPLILGGVLLILASWQMIRALLAPKPAQPAGGKASAKKALKEFLHDNAGEAKVLALTIMLILYILLMQWLGFFVSTFLLVVFTSRLMETGEWGRPIALAAGVGLFCYLLFEVWIKLSFPRGLLF